MLDAPFMLDANVPVRRRKPGLRALALGLAAVALLAAVFQSAPACNSLPHPGPITPVAEEAAAAFEEARSWARALPLDGAIGQAAVAGAVDGEGTAAVGARERARSAAERATALAPEWVPPRRLLDDLARADLLGIEALEAHRAHLVEHDEDAGRLYLAGRLEGARGRARYERAVAVDPDLAWGHHGLAWLAADEGDVRLALRRERAALARARSSFERSYFTAALARFHVVADEPRMALDLLQARLASPEITAVDLVELSVQAALVELGMVFRPEYGRGWARALDLLREHDLTEREVESLVALMRLFRAPDGAGELELQLALASRASPARDRLRAELMLESRSTPLALGLLKRSRAEHGTPGASGLTLRAARFAAGQIGVAIEEWLRDVPGEALDSAGLPQDPALRAVVREARTLGTPPGREALISLGERLIEAGWFREARSVASVLAVDDLDAGLELEDRAASGQALVEGLRQLMHGLDERVRASGRLASPAGEQRPALAGAPPGAEPVIEDLGGLLSAMAPIVARAQVLLGGEIDAERIERELTRSPQIHYGPIGKVVHPGPWFSQLDQAQGRGVRGAPVPGLAALCARLGRFGLFGQLAGEDGPDGTLLQRVLVEERAGSHLGVPWSGTVALCEGAEMLSRAGQRGATIAGAAVHEGYWLDFDALRGDRDRWAAYEREFAAPGSIARLERALSTRGLALESDARDESARRRERRAVDTPLGQAERVRLAVLRDRLAAGGALLPPDGEGPQAGAGLVPLDELVRLTALHEQAHLCDRTRFLPLSSNLGAALGLLLEAGFSPSGVARLLEYRAELTALCEAPDPRVVLVSILGVAESGVGVTPHPAGYRELLADLVAVLDRELAAHPQRWPELDPQRVLVHQLHRLSAERMRELGLLLARRKGLIEER